MGDKIIEVTGLQKSYGKVHAVKGIDFYVEKGKLFAFLGPNGAGKSTTIDTICTFLKPDSGEVIVDSLKLGEDDNAIRNIIGAVFQDGLLDRLLTVEENLKARGGLYGLKGKALDAAVKEAVEKTGVGELLKRPYGKLSGGQRRRCDIARALINKPKILFLDEPTTGLDPQTRKNIWETVKRLQKETQMTVFLTTHYMEEAAEADYVIIIDDGKIAARGTPITLKMEYANDKLYLDAKGDIGELEGILTQQGHKVKRIADRLVIKLSDTLDAIDIVGQCRELVKGFEVINGSMDDVFISVTGKEIRE